MFFLIYSHLDYCRYQSELPSSPPLDSNLCSSAHYGDKSARTPPSCLTPYTGSLLDTILNLLLTFKALYVLKIHLRLTDLVCSFPTIEIHRYCSQIKVCYKQRSDLFHLSPVLWNSTELIHNKSVYVQSSNLAVCLSHLFHKLSLQSCRQQRVQSVGQIIFVLLVLCLQKKNKYNKCYMM